jgi:hypothetical protein
MPETDNTLVCQSYGRVWVIGKNRETNTALVFRPRCKRWNCPQCGQINRRVWVARTMNAVSELQETGKSIDFVTLTHRGNLSAEETRERWRRSWPKLSSRMRRAAIDIEYCYVHEQHKDNRLHTHMITTGMLSKRWWKDNGAMTGFGYMNDASEARDPLGAGAYVSKYLSKQLGVNAWPPGWRRITTSRGWPKLPKTETPEGWKFYHALPNMETDEIEALLNDQGYDVINTDHRAAYEIIDFLEEERGIAPDENLC